MRIFVDCFGDLGQVFLTDLIALVNFNKLFVRTYDVLENQPLIRFLKLRSVQNKTKSYTEFNYKYSPDYDAVKCPQKPHECKYYGRELPYGGLIKVKWPIEKVDNFIQAMIYPPFEPAKLMVDGEAGNIYKIAYYKKLMKI